jgi:hypothetical protein
MSNSSHLAASRHETQVEMRHASQSFVQPGRLVVFEEARAESSPRIR